MTVCVSTQSHVKALVKYLLIDVAEVYRLSMIWELALNVVFSERNKLKIVKRVIKF